MPEAIRNTLVASVIISLLPLSALAVSSEPPAPVQQQKTDTASVTVIGNPTKQDKDVSVSSIQCTDAAGEDVACHQCETVVYELDGKSAACYSLERRGCTPPPGIKDYCAVSVLKDPKATMSGIPLSEYPREMIEGDRSTFVFPEKPAPTQTFKGNASLDFDNVFLGYGQSPDQSSALEGVPPAYQQYFLGMDVSHITPPEGKPEDYGFTSLGAGLYRTKDGTVLSLLSNGNGTFASVQSLNPGSLTNYTSPTMREAVTNFLGSRFTPLFGGDSYASYDFAHRLANLSDFTPLGFVWMADAGAANIENGHFLAGAAEIAMGAVPGLRGADGRLVISYAAQGIEKTGVLKMFGETEAIAPLVTNADAVAARGVSVDLEGAGVSLGKSTGGEIGAANENVYNNNILQFVPNTALKDTGQGVAGNSAEILSLHSARDEAYWRRYMDNIVANNMMSPSMKVSLLSDSMISQEQLAVDTMRTGLFSDQKVVASFPKGFEIYSDPTARRTALNFLETVTREMNLLTPAEQAKLAGLRGRPQIELLSGDGPLTAEVTVYGLFRETTKEISLENPNALAGYLRQFIK